MKIALALLLGGSILASVTVARAQHAMMSDQELMAKLKDAAPARVLGSRPN